MPTCFRTWRKYCLSVAEAEFKDKKLAKLSAVIRRDCDNFSKAEIEVHATEVNQAKLE